MQKSSRSVTKAPKPAVNARDKKRNRSIRFDKAVGTPPVSAIGIARLYSSRALSSSRALQRCGLTPR
eukprot:1052818-Prymnesium_polylepis.1